MLVLGLSWWCAPEHSSCDLQLRGFALVFLDSGPGVNEAKEAMSDLLEVEHCRGVESFDRSTGTMPIGRRSSLHTNCGPLDDSRDLSAARFCDAVTYNLDRW